MKITNKIYNQIMEWGLNGVEIEEIILRIKKEFFIIIEKEELNEIIHGNF